MDQLPAETPIIIIIEACYSGNFIGSALSAPNRTIITSASSDQQAIITRSSSFSRHFFQQYIAKNQTVAEAFERTSQWTERMPLHRAQRPQLDADGDGQANEKQDYRALADSRIPADIQSLSLVPEFVSTLEPIQLAEGVNQYQLEIELSAISAEQVSATIIPPDLDLEQALTSWQQLDAAIIELELRAEANNRYQFNYDNFTQIGDYTLIIQAQNQDGEAVPLQTTISVPGVETKPVDKLTGDVNGDGTVNIFDLVIAAGSFGKTGEGIMGDVNGDGGVNIFDLVIVAGNFGKSLAAVPSIASKIELTTEQKHHIASVIDQLESNSNRSNAEEIVLNILIAILPERLPTQTQLLASYPNPFNSETWIPVKLAQDSTVSATIYDVTGKQIRTIELGHLSAGNYVESNRAIYWDGRTEDGEQVSSGTYFYQIEAGDYTETRKMVILK